MTPAARVQAAIELVDETIMAAVREGAAADTLIQRYFKTRRYAGSTDRRAVRELVFACIRTFGERPDTGRAAMIGYASHVAPTLLPHFGTGPHAPAAITPGEAMAKPTPLPSWLAPRFTSAFGAQAETAVAALNGRAQLDLRVNLLKAERRQIIAMIPGLSPTPLAPHGLRAAESFNVETETAYIEGLVEVQDEGSQLVVAACDAAPGELVIDLCAGAGGKTLALAADMANVGRIIACDTDRGRLSRLSPRATRAGAGIVENRLLDPGDEMAVLGDLAGSADVVLIDAPCSGTGTWRRNPEARWRLTAARLCKLTQLQARLIDIGVGLLRPGGRLVYAVCSVLPDEGAAQADALEDRHKSLIPRLAILPGLPDTGRLLLAPHSHGTDGFFIAGYEKSC